MEMKICVLEEGIRGDLSLRYRRSNPAPRGRFWRWIFLEEGTSTVFKIHRDGETTNDQLELPTDNDRPAIVAPERDLRTLDRAIASITVHVTTPNFYVQL